MYQTDIQIRVRYSETDQMGYVYYGNYAAYFEVARTETFRQLGIHYKEMEADGVMMPVLELKSKYHPPGQVRRSAYHPVTAEGKPDRRAHKVRIRSL